MQLELNQCRQKVHTLGNVIEERNLAASVELKSFSLVNLPKFEDFKILPSLWRTRQNKELHLDPSLMCLKQYVMKDDVVHMHRDSILKEKVSILAIKSTLLRPMFNISHLDRFSIFASWFARNSNLPGGKVSPSETYVPPDCSWLVAFLVNALKLEISPQVKQQRLTSILPAMFTFSSQPLTKELWLSSSNSHLKIVWETGRHGIKSSFSSIKKNCTSKFFRKELLR